MYKYKMIMKKILLGFIMLVTAATMNAQIELEHVFDGDIMLNESAWDSYLIGADDMFVIRNNDKMYIYRSDFTLYGIFDSFDLLTRNIFTMDNKLCFVTIITEGDWPNYKTKITISNEDNETIKEIQLDGYTEGSICLIKFDNKYKFVIVEYLPENDSLTGEHVGTLYKTHVYSCPGNGETSTSVENVSAKVKRNAYPNPATDLVTLPYDANGATSMKIYDMQGKLVERKFLDKNKQELQLNVKDYPTGMYFFEVNGESNSFIVE